MEGRGAGQSQYAENSCLATASLNLDNCLPRYDQSSSHKAGKESRRQIFMRVFPSRVFAREL